MSDLTETLHENIPLSEMITSLKQELAVAMEKGAGDAIQFDVAKAEVEVAFVAKRSKEGGGEVKFWVVTAGGKAVVTDETTHRFKLTLEPHIKDKKSGSRERVKVGR